jgi:quercetin dioxygenase-like cupin family protein
MTINIQFERIAPGRVVGPHRHALETIVYVAAGEIVFEHGETLDRQEIVRPGDVLLETAGGYHRARNDGTIDALCLLATVDGVEDAPDLRIRAPIDLHKPVRRRESARVVRRGGITRSVIARAGDLPTATWLVAESIVPPGVSGEWHRHPGAEHVLVVLAGRGEITVEDVTETLEPLTGIRIVAGATHRVVATGRTPLRYVVIGTPGLDPERDRRPAEEPERQLDV